MFDPSGANAFYIVNQQGIMRYDFEANTLAVVRADINTTWVDRAFFSPDGRSLIVFDESEYGATSMYYIADPLGQ